MAFSAEAVAVLGARQGLFGCSPPGLCSPFLPESFLRSGYSCWKSGCSQPGSAQTSARAHSVLVLGDRPTAVKVFRRSCLPILCHGDCFSADAFRVPVSERLVSADTARLHVVRSLGVSVCLPRKTFSNT